MIEDTYIYINRYIYMYGLIHACLAKNISMPTLDKWLNDRQMSEFKIAILVNEFLFLKMVMMLCLWHPGRWSPVNRYCASRDAYRFWKLKGVWQWQHPRGCRSYLCPSLTPYPAGTQGWGVAENGPKNFTKTMKNYNLLQFSQKFGEKYKKIKKYAI